MKETNTDIQREERILWNTSKGLSNLILVLQWINCKKTNKLNTFNCVFYSQQKKAKCSNRLR